MQMADRFDELSEAIEASVQQWTTDSFGFEREEDAEAFRREFVR